MKRFILLSYVLLFLAVALLNAAPDPEVAALVAQGRSQYLAGDSAAAIVVKVQ